MLMSSQFTRLRRLSYPFQYSRFHRIGEGLVKLLQTILIYTPVVVRQSRKLSLKTTVLLITY